MGRLLDTDETDTEEDYDSSRPLELAVQPLRVCVVGASLAGLATAWELERVGHHVTVFDPDLVPGERYGDLSTREPDGKLRSFPVSMGVQADDGWLSRWVSQFGVTVERTDAVLVDARDAVVTPEPPPKPDQWILSVRSAEAARVTRAAHGWFELRGLSRTHEWLCTQLTHAGRADLADPELPTFLLYQAARWFGLLEAFPRIPWVHVQGGLGHLCRQIARNLSDVRLGPRVRSVRRSGRHVAVEADTSHEFDCLVVACPPREALRFLDTSPLEQRSLELLRQKKKIASLYLLESGIDGRSGMTTRMERDLTDSITSFCFPEERVVRIETHFEIGDDLAPARARIAARAKQIAGESATFCGETIVPSISYVDSGDFGADTYDGFVSLQGHRNTFYANLPPRVDLPRTQIGIGEWLRKRIVLTRKDAGRVHQRGTVRVIGPPLPTPPADLRPMHEPLELRAELWSQARACEHAEQWEEAARIYGRLRPDVEALSRLAVIFERLDEPHRASQCYDELAREYRKLAETSQARADELAIEPSEAPDPWPRDPNHRNSG